MPENDLQGQADDSVVVTTPQTTPQEPPFDPKKYVPVERFNGLQGSVEKLSNENKNLKVKLQDTSTERELLNTELTSLKKDLEGQTGTLKQEAEQAKTLAQKTALELEAIKKVVTQFPELSQFYAKGLLRTDGLEGEALTTYLTEYKEALGTLQLQAKQDFVQGSTPAAGTGNAATASAADLYDKLMSMSPSDPKYKEIQNQYFNVIREEKKNG